MTKPIHKNPFRDHERWNEIDEDRYDEESDADDVVYDSERPLDRYGNEKKKEEIRNRRRQGGR